ncbi:SemiSWEET transporter [Enterococcus thailandicus]|uniref:SemiSWEET transporter n=1 Tax=Enterococcus thailandicus TaxID=417368 RepID=UPI0039848670
MQYIGPVAAFLATISFVPQLLSVIKTKDTSSISLGMYLLFIAGVFLWIVHGIYIKDWPVIIANGVTFILSSIILICKLRYK